MAGKKKYAKKLPKFINEQQLDKMIEQINSGCTIGARNMAILVVLFRSGLRVSEITNLIPEDLDFINGLILVQSGKGNKDRYTVMDQKTAEVLEHWLKLRPRSIYLFPTFKGGKLDTRYIRQMCYRISEKAGVYLQDGKEKKLVNPHALRHGFATRALNELDMNIREVQEMLGHENLSTTSVYTHVNPLGLAKKYRERSV